MLRTSILTTTKTVTPQPLAANAVEAITLSLSSEQHNYWEDNKIIQAFASWNYTEEHQLNTVSYAFIFKTNKGSKNVPLS